MVRPALFPRFLPTPPPPAPVPSPADGIRKAAEAEARQRAVREAEAAARAEAEARGRQAMAALHAAAVRLSARADELTAELDRALPDAVFLLARLVLGREVTLDAGAMREAIGAALASLRETPTVLHVDPGAFAALEAWRTDGGAPSASLSIVADPALAAGDWLVETDDGFRDGRLASQLEAAWRLVDEAGT